MNTPKSWKEINIKKYQKLHNLYKQEGLDDIDLFINRLAIILDKTIEEVEQIELTDFNTFKDDLLFLDTQPRQIADASVINVAGKELKMIDLTKLKLGQFIDLEHYSKDVIENMPYILAILYNEDADFLKENCDIETALSVFFYLYLFALDFIPSDIADYSMLDKMTMNMKEMMNHLQQEEKA
jgi:hypothetical protein